MSAVQSFDADLPGNLRYTVQLQPDRDDVDFNVYVHDAHGELITSDTTPDAGAICSFDAAEDGRFRISIELAEGRAGFSINISSEPLGRAAQATTADYAAPSAVATASADATGSALTADEAAAMVDAHNAWRGRYGVADARWSSELAVVAQQWADELAANGMRMQHRSPNEFGENIYWCSGRAASPSDVVDAWGSEVQFYDEAANNWWPKAGHFSQVVWHDSTQIGCGVARVGGQEMWVCNYAPRGNWTGQRPYPV